MPQTNDRLQKKFMTSTDDGIGTCESIIRNAGGQVSRGYITYNGNDPDVLDAVQFLIEEWDYSYEMPPRQAVPSAVTEIDRLLKALPTDEDRLAAMANICHYCGSLDLPCHCMNDE